MLYIYLCANLITSNYLLSSNYGLDLFWKYFLLLLPDWTGHVVNWGVDDCVSVNGKGVTAQRGDFGDSQWHTLVPPARRKASVKFQWGNFFFFSNLWQGEGYSSHVRFVNIKARTGRRIIKENVSVNKQIGSYSLNTISVNSIQC